MGLKEKVEQEIERLKPRLMELAQGQVDMMSIDEEAGIVTLRVFRGMLISGGLNACCLWSEKLLKEAIPEINQVITVFGPLPADEWTSELSITPIVHSHDCTGFCAQGTAHLGVFLDRSIYVWYV